MVYIGSQVAAPCLASANINPSIHRSIRLEKSPTGQGISEKVRMLHEVGTFPGNRWGSTGKTNSLKAIFQKKMILDDHHKDSLPKLHEWNPK